MQARDGEEQGRFGSPHVQTRRLSAAGNVSRELAAPFGACVAVQRQHYNRTGVCVCVSHSGFEATALF